MSTTWTAEAHHLLGALVERTPAEPGRRLDGQLVRGRPGAVVVVGLGEGVHQRPQVDRRDTTASVVLPKR